MEYDRNKILWQKNIHFFIFNFLSEFSQHFFAFFRFWIIMKMYDFIYYINNMGKRIRRFCRKIRRGMRDRNSNVSILIECIAIIMIWRWVWDLLEIYVLPNSPLASNLTCVIVWILVLLLDDWKLFELQEDDPHRWRK
jgi:hypothetical protein